MIEYCGDLFEVEADYLLHQCNCQCAMNSGVAKAIFTRYPEVKESDLKTKSKTPIEKLGTYEVIECEDINVINAYGQLRYGKERIQTDYCALGQIFKKIRVGIETSNRKFSIKLPFLLGCGLAGGDWNIVEAILIQHFYNCPLTTIKICANSSNQRKAEFYSDLLKRRYEYERIDS